MSLITLANKVEERYRRYLQTTFYFKDPLLRTSFEEALSSGHLAKGPYLEATPVFKRSQTPQTLFRSILGFQPDQGFLEAVHSNRPLFRHQEEAIQKVSLGRNVVVATGTGSGKTEAFLYPILLHLYQEFRAGRLCPGVRALILYPMNALANDQRDRLGEICKRFQDGNSSFWMSFGQYTGETPEDEKDTRRHARARLADRIPGELVLRSEMRTTPPHILLTNYSMLEYLLIRPDDSPLFDSGQARWWTFIVLDEAHQYRGSRGIEMAMLLRRLKCRLRKGGRLEPFRCLATSATLADGQFNKGAVAKFASDLFDEEFQEEDVLLGETEPIPEPGSGRLHPDAYQSLIQALNEEDTKAESLITELGANLGLQPSGSGDLTKTLGILLQHDSRAICLRRLITGNPIEVNEIADQIFYDLSNGKRIAALSALVDLLLRAKNPTSDAPLLSARYHLFLRSLEGAFISYWPQEKILLDRRTQNQGGMAFEVALCRECGQHYLVGKQSKDGKLVEANRDPAQPDFGADFFRPVSAGGYSNENEEGRNSKAGKEKVFRLCVHCGKLWRDTQSLICPGCGREKSILVEKQQEAAEKEDQIPRCSACGYRAPDPVREVVHGTDGPHAVIATTMYQNLPLDRKKVLAFSDGRQEAAFFAWYLENSFRDILSRNLVLKAVRKLSPLTAEGLSLGDLTRELRRLCRDRKILPPATGDLELRHEAWLRAYREFLTDELRISLEGVGLVQWLIKWPDWLRIPDVLLDAPWTLTEQEARNLILILLDFMRADKAVELRTEEGISLDWSDLGLQASPMRVCIGEPGNQKGVRSWDGKTGMRARFLGKILIRNGFMEQDAVQQALDTLRAVWQTFTECERNISSEDRLLLPVGDARRLNPAWWRLRPITDNDPLFQCDTCGRLQMVSINRVCPRRNCPGTLKEVRSKDLEPNHYRLLYSDDLSGPLRVEEHTAQLDKERAREFQREFREGKIHVLSCSTTFEVGVDLGNLDTIFLRNVPPEAFNYAQRVGRAGRRSGYPGFAITYCRRNPHDLYHFSEPGRMLSGKVQPPSISLQNERIITRHITATALSEFFRAFGERFKSVETLCGDLLNPAGTTDCKAFLHRHRIEIEESLRAFIPLNMFDKVGLNDGQWIERVAGRVVKNTAGELEESRFALAEDEVSSDYKNVKRLEEESSNRKDHKTAEWAQKRANTIAGEEVLSFLSRRAVIPKYGFPVDVVDLDTQRTQQNKEACEVLLQRDLSMAISEFAPTSSLIANKKEWTSYGLKKVVEKEWDRWLYKRCTRHNVFYRWKKGQPEPAPQCEDQLATFEYVVPLFGFLTNRNRPKDPRSRTAKVFTTRPYFAGQLGPDPGAINLPMDSPLVTLRKSSPGMMVVLCEGRRGGGFYICSTCGAGFMERQRTHQTPYGQDCLGVLDKAVSLGHRFVTDVLKLQFHLKPEGGVEPPWFAYSLAYALVEGAAMILEIPSIDLSATVMYTEQYPVPPIILYDNVPGGAGLVARLEKEEMLKACLESARKRVSGNCGCDENTSCYGCLRSYRNQFAHQHLQRGTVMHYLEDMLSRWK